MRVVGALASAKGRRDEIPNIRLAEAIVASHDTSAVKELIALLADKSRNIQSDSIKVLYEVAARKPALVASYWKVFAALLSGSNNRLIWGAMTTLDAVTSEVPASVATLVDQIVAAADSGTVITRDHAVGILAKLSAQKRFAARSFPELLRQLERCPVNQLPMYAEWAGGMIRREQRASFAKIVTARMDELTTESKRRRIAAVLMKVGKAESARR